MPKRRAGAPGDLLSRAEFGRRMGIGAKEVGEATKKGLPTGKGGKIPLGAGRAWVNANRQTRINTKTESVPVQLYTGARAHKMAFDARKSQADARRAELELAVRQGELVEVAEVRRTWVNICRMTRDRMQAIPERVCTRIATTLGVDPGPVRVIFTDEIGVALEALAGELKYEAPTGETQAAP